MMGGEMSGEIAQKSKSTTALFTLEQVGMFTAPVTRQGPRPLKLLVAFRTLHAVMHLFLMPLETDPLCVLIATDQAFVAFTTSFGGRSVLVIPARRRKRSVT